MKGVTQIIVFIIVFMTLNLLFILSLPDIGGDIEYPTYNVEPPKNGTGVLGISFEIPILGQLNYFFTQVWNFIDTTIRTLNAIWSTYQLVDEAIGFPLMQIFFGALAALLIFCVIRMLLFGGQ